MIRPAAAADAPQLLALMRKLAVFEGYADKFAVTEQVLLERGLDARHPAEFSAWVAHDDSRALLGYAVVYVIAFTFDLRPTVVLKELFVEEQARGRRLGKQLFMAVAHHARAIDARLLRWQVLPGNDAAKRFYCSHGGMLDAGWENWILDLDSALPQYNIAGQ